MNEAAFLGGLITHLRFCQFPNTRDNAIRPEQFRRIELQNCSTLRRNSAVKAGLG